MTDCSFTAAMRPSSCQRFENKTSDWVTTGSASRTAVSVPSLATHSSRWLFALSEPQLQTTARTSVPALLFVCCFQQNRVCVCARVMVVNHSTIDQKLLNHPVPVVACTNRGVVGSSPSYRSLSHGTLCCVLFLRVCTASVRLRTSVCLAVSGCADGVFSPAMTCNQSRVSTCFQPPGISSAHCHPNSRMRASRAAVERCCNHLSVCVLRQHSDNYFVLLLPQELIRNSKAKSATYIAEMKLPEFCVYWVSYPPRGSQGFWGAWGFPSGGRLVWPPPLGLLQPPGLNWPAIPTLTKAQPPNKSCQTFNFFKANSELFSEKVHKLNWRTFESSKFLFLDNIFSLTVSF